MSDESKIEGYKRSIQRGIEYPYDGDDEGQSPVPLTPERVAAYGVLTDLLDRRGIGHALDDIDYEIKEEIVETLAGIIKEAMKESNK